MAQNRSYHRSHPWLDYGLDLNRFDPDLWIMLGEAQSKIEHIAGVPLVPKAAQQMHLLYLSKGALATTAIEGNTLSEDEVRDYIEGRLTLPPSREYLGREIDNIVRACNQLTRELAERGPVSLDVTKIEWMNTVVLAGLPVEEGVIPGGLRRHMVTVGRYRCAPPEDGPYLLERLLEQLNRFPSPSENESLYALIKAVHAHLNLVWIHPFGDGNGRTARLLELYILLSAGFPSPTAHLLSNHYNRTRTEYYRQLDAARNPDAGPAGFIKYAVQGFIDGLREQIDFIKDQQWSVSWVNYIHDQFKGKNNPTDFRRRDLVLRLSEEEGFVPTRNIPDLSPALARAYAGKTSRAITRDLNALQKMNLVEYLKGRVRARKELILAFKPWRVDPR